LTPLSHAVVAAAIPLRTSSAVRSPLAGFSADPLDTDSRVIAGIGHASNAVRSVTVMVATQPRRSPTSVYPESRMTVAVTASGLLSIGLDLVTEKTVRAEELRQHRATGTTAYAQTGRGQG
jgi:hypothetical protein